MKPRADSEAPCYVITTLAGISFVSYTPKNLDT